MFAALFAGTNTGAWAVCFASLLVSPRLVALLSVASDSSAPAAASTSRCDRTVMRMISPFPCPLMQLNKRFPALVECFLPFAINVILLGFVVSFMTGLSGTVRQRTFLR